MYENDYDYMASLESRVYVLEEEIEDLRGQVQRLGAALMAAGVPGNMVDLIAAG